MTPISILTRYRVTVSNHLIDNVDVQNFTVDYWLSEGLRPEKLVLGMPMYGQSFTLDNAADNGLNAASTGGGTAGQFTRAKVRIVLLLFKSTSAHQF